MELSEYFMFVSAAAFVGIIVLNIVMRRQRRETGATK